MFKFISILIYLGSIAALLVTGGLVSSVLALYPPSYISSFGPVTPIISKAYAGWLPAAQAVTWALSVVSVIIGIYLWRSRHPMDGKQKAALAIGAFNYFLALFFTTTLLLAYFYLPKVANAVQLSNQADR